jgi:hypothetical protein
VPVGETGGSKGMGEIREEDHPECTSGARKLGGFALVTDETRQADDKALLLKVRHTL